MQPDTDNRRARADSIIAGLSPTETQRYRDAVGELRVCWARQYGDRLSTLVIENLAAEAVLNMTVLEAIHGQPPLTEQSWDDLAKDIASEDQWVQLNVAHSDKKAAADIRERTLSGMPGARRMAMERSGELDAFVENAVREELDARCAQRVA